VSLIRDVLRVLRDLLTFTFNQRKPALLLVVVLVIVIAAFAQAVTTVAPVALYPFI